MFIDLEPIFNSNDGRAEINYTLHIDDAFSPDEEKCFSPVSVQGSVYNKTGVVSLDARAELDYTAPCDRCAASATKHFVFPIKHFLIDKLNDEDNDLYIQVENYRLDLDELVREDILLALPLSFLCKEDCKGLCIMCGCNQNTEPCSCKKPIDPRWAALSELSD